MEEIKIIVEIEGGTEGELNQADKLKIEDVVWDALREAGYEIVRVRVHF